MARTVKLSHVEQTLEDLSHPISKDAAIDDLRGVTVEFADGEEPLADVLGRSNADGFDSASDLELELYSNLPTEAVGEPGQSEGEG